MDCNCEETYQILPCVIGYTGTLGSDFPFQGVLEDEDGVGLPLIGSTGVLEILDPDNPIDPPFYTTTALTFDDDGNILHTIPGATTATLTDPGRLVVTITLPVALGSLTRAFFSGPIQFVAP